MALSPLLIAAGVVMSPDTPPLYSIADEPAKDLLFGEDLTARHPLQLPQRLAPGAVTLTLRDHGEGMPYALVVGESEQETLLVSWSWLESVSNEPGQVDFSLVDAHAPAPKTYLVFGGFLLFALALKHQRDLRRKLAREIRLQK